MSARLTLESLLGVLRGARPPRAAPAPLSAAPWPARLQSLARARWEPQRATESPPATAPVYTPTSAMLWLAAAEKRHGGPVTTRQVLISAGWKHPDKAACNRLSMTLRKAGAKSAVSGRGQTHLLWSTN